MEGRGREDVKLLGLLIANQEGDAWAELMSIIDSPLPVDVMLDLVEEILKVGQKHPFIGIIAKDGCRRP